MNVAWGVVLVVLSLLCWGGQVISVLAPQTAVDLSLQEAEDTVEPTFWTDARAEAAWDSLTLWTMLAAGVLLIADRGSWAYFGLIGGGMYVYFAGRSIFTRVALRRAGFRIGDDRNVRIGLVMSAVWGLAALVTMAAAVAALSPS